MWLGLFIREVHSPVTKSTVSTLTRLLTATLLAIPLIACQTHTAATESGEVAQSVPNTIAAPTPTETPSARPESLPSPLPPLDDLIDAEATATPLPSPARPARVEIASAGIDVPVLIVALNEDGYLPTPDDHAGYWALSSTLDGGGNVVIVGHNRTSPIPIFRELFRVEIGDTILLTDQFGAEYTYEVTEIQTLDVEGSPENAQRTVDYIAPELPDRLTLVTCQPEGSCTGRLIVVAKPVDA